MKGRRNAFNSAPSSHGGVMWIEKAASYRGEYVGGAGACAEPCPAGTAVAAGAALGFGSWGLGPPHLGAACKRSSLMYRDHTKPLALERN